MTPRTMRIAYQIYWLLQRTGGDCTVHDMAEATGESWQRCVNVCRQRGWRYTHISCYEVDGSYGMASKPVAPVSRDFAREAGIEVSGMVDA